MAESSRRLPLLYLSGPIATRPDTYRDAFREAQFIYSESGDHVVLNPVDIGDRLNGDGVRVLPPVEYLREDIRGLLMCDGIILLEGWRESKGAKCEAAIARTLNLTVYDFESGFETTWDAVGPITIDSGYE